MRSQQQTTQSEARMSRRPAARNPMVFVKRTKPAGAYCTAPGCQEYIVEGRTCENCEITKYLAETAAPAKVPPK